MCWDKGMQFDFGKTSADTGFEHNGKWIWNICWAETLSSTESDEAEELLYLLADISPKQDKLDSMRWIPDHSVMGE
ncbi:uncharacterized protein LOC123917418 isoform X3 [Trifolium pratense]|uniref:uncharacterized protein LOC123917418 isoform X3 n=1 Tax=Trifolium pratense TaxID=57577 RepID=UPI001E695D60|nr:uncharacterized protein LOC123917418 isoform X3 [Trifolium pratense]